VSYAELAAASAFSFLEGASMPDELVEAARELGLAAIGIADANTVAGVVRAHVAAKTAGLRLLAGCRLVLRDAPDLLCYPENRAAWGRLTRLLSLGKGRAKKGECQMHFADVLAHAGAQVFIVMPPADLPATFALWLRAAAAKLPGQLYLAAGRRHLPDDAQRLRALAALAAAARIKLVAVNDVLYHEPGRRTLQDVLRCIRHGCRVDDAGTRLEPNGERSLKPPAEMARLFKGYEYAIAAQQEIIERCGFSLDELRYEYPDEPVPADTTPDQHLANLTWAGAAARYPSGVPAPICATLNKELELIARLKYARYFLTVNDIVQFARGKKILCQGRGSAANSAICFALGITAVDPAEINLLFERFISAERSEPPDIDVDFEHERREEVIQYLYARYGRERAAIVATVIHYRPKSAIREVGKALGLAEDATAALAAQTWNAGDELWDDDRVREAGLDPRGFLLRRVIELSRELVGLPRHLSQHVGGFVLTRGRLDESVPIGPAAMDNRSFIEWDKDDIDALGMMKVDVLALGMLTCIRKCFAMLGIADLADIPRDDPAVYAMLSKGDSLGVFQVESRAQMNMLPRLKPREFYDLVIEVAIVRPGPIQGDMVHPYLRRRKDPSLVEYPKPHPDFGEADELKKVLGRTLGVPLFQEQAMQLAIVAAQFTPGEANLLRRSMATFRNMGKAVSAFRDKLVGGMVRRGYDAVFAENCFKQIEGFGTYGFPESHAASFAKLVYVSSWLKCHHPAAFAAALLNSQPMGFYAPAQIVRDAREHGVEVRPADVNFSAWDCVMQQGALRLGLRLIGGFREDWAAAIVAARGKGFADFAALAAAGLPRDALAHLAAADALRSLNLNRRNAAWQVGLLETAPGLPLLSGITKKLSEPELPLMRRGEHVVADYRTTGLSLKSHPMALLRGHKALAGVLTCAAAAAARDGAKITTAGIVTVRQRPGSAKGTVFMTIEDETGVANIVIWPSLVETLRRAIIGSALVLVQGRVQRSEEGVVHIVAENMDDASYLIGSLESPMARADELPAPRRTTSHPRQERVVRKSRDFH
jgi:error-prone DNA polymerase